MPPDTDWAHDADVFELEVQPGDAVVLATDGLLDNCFPEDLVRLAPRSASEVQQVGGGLAGGQGCAGRRHGAVAAAASGWHRPGMCQLHCLLASGWGFAFCMLLPARLLA